MFDPTANTSNLTSIVQFTTRIQNYSSFVIGNIFIGSCRKDCVYIELVIDGLSGHAAKLPVTKNIDFILNYHNYKNQTMALLKNLQQI
jgi:hypothetical protein